jgi:hypothetical protein
MFKRRREWTSRIRRFALAGLGLLAAGLTLYQVVPAVPRSEHDEVLVFVGVAAFILGLLSSLVWSADFPQPERRPLGPAVPMDRDLAWWDGKQTRRVRSVVNVNFNEIDQATTEQAMLLLHECARVTLLDDDRMGGSSTDDAKPRELIVKRRRLVATWDDHCRWLGELEEWRKLKASARRRTR